MVVTVTPTIMDGTVVRWYRSIEPAMADATLAVARGELLSASRDGVLVRCYLHEVPDDVLRAAREAYQQLKRDRNADLRHLATHRRARLFSGELVEVSQHD